jgi:hypothetical protein
MPPAVGGSAVGRPHPSALPSLAQDHGARGLGDRLVASQEHRARRDPMVQPEGDQQARSRPGGPSALGQHALRGRGRPRRLSSHGAEPMRDGPSPRGQYGGPHQDHKPVRRRGGKRGTQHRQSRYRLWWNVPGGGPSIGFTTASLRAVLAAISPAKIRLPNSLTRGSGSKGQKSSSYEF